MEEQTVIRDVHEVLQDETTFEVFQIIWQCEKRRKQVSIYGIDLYFPELEQTQYGNIALKALKDAGLIKEYAPMWAWLDGKVLDLERRRAIKLFLTDKAKHISSKWRDKLDEEAVFIIPEELGLILPVVISEVCDQFYSEGHNATQLNSEVFQKALFEVIMSLRAV